MYFSVGQVVIGLIKAVFSPKSMWNKENVNLKGQFERHGALVVNYQV